MIVAMEQFGNHHLHHNSSNNRQNHHGPPPPTTTSSSSTASTSASLPASASASALTTSSNSTLGGPLPLDIPDSFFENDVLSGQPNDYEFAPRASFDPLGFSLGMASSSTSSNPSNFNSMSLVQNGDGSLLQPSPSASSTISSTSSSLVPFSSASASSSSNSSSISEQAKRQQQNSAFLSQQQQHPLTTNRYHQNFRRHHHPSNNQAISASTSPTSSTASPIAKSKQPPKPKFSPEDDSLLIELKEVKHLTWREIATHFDNRTAGALQVRYCTKLKGRKVPWSQEDEDALLRAINEYELERWTIISEKMGGKYSPTMCKEKHKQLKSRKD